MTDILFHKIEVYGKEADEFIRKIDALSSRRELDEWWDKEVSWNCDSAAVLRKAKAKYEELLQRAKNNDWEAK